MTVNYRLEVHLPSTFRRLDGGNPEFSDLGRQEVARLRQALNDAPEIATSAFVVLVREATPPRIGAVGWFEASPAEPGLREIVKESAESPLWQSRQSFATRVAHHELGDRDILTVQLIQPVEIDRLGEPDAVLVERCSSTLVDARHGAVVRLEVIAFDLGLFDDIAATSLEILTSATAQTIAA